MKVVAPQRPDALAVRYTHIGFRISEPGTGKINVEFHLGALRGGSQKAGVAILQHGKKAGVGRIDPHGYASDFNDEAQTFHFCG